MNEIVATDLEEIEAPWGRKIRLQNLAYGEGGLPIVRLRILEGKRITDLELDPDTARHLAKSLENWASSR